MRPDQKKMFVFAGLLVALGALLWMGAPASGQAQTIGCGQIWIVGLQVDIDTRPDLDGIQSTRTAVKDFPAAVLTVVGNPGPGRRGPQICKLRRRGR